jgi:hypothetical protein
MIYSRLAQKTTEDTIPVLFVRTGQEGKNHAEKDGGG